MTPTSIVAYVALFAAVGFVFLFVALLLGRFLRAAMPTAQKVEVYECGEPPIGSAFVQFDLRFYVVALVFIIFEVEVAFFFPWAAVFGKVTRLSDADFPSAAAAATYMELGVPLAASPGLPSPAAKGEPRGVAEARGLALASMADISVFFAVLLVGFAYVWKQGDLNWVRALRHPPTTAAEQADQSAAGQDLQ